MAAEGALNQILEDPVLATNKGSTSDEASKNQINQLKEQLKTKEVQIDMLTQIFLQKEMALQAQIRDLQQSLENTNKGKGVESSHQREELKETDEDMGITLEVEMQDLQTEEQAPLEEDPLPTAEEELSHAEAELSKLIAEMLEPIQKECIEWEKRVLHSANLSYLSWGEATKAYNRPTLPYALIKHETIKLKESLTLPCPPEDIGGYEPVNLQQWQSKANMQNQPAWRLTWFRKHPSSRTTYARAPREIRVDPIYCPVRRRRTWEAYHRRARTQPTWLNFPLLPAPEAGHEPTERYMVTTLEQTIQQYKGIPDLACQMLSKIAKMLLVCIDGFHTAIHTKAPWTRFLEGRQGLSWNLQLAPEPRIIMGLFTRIESRS